MRSLKDVLSRDPRSELGFPPKEVKKTDLSKKSEGSQERVVTPLFPIADTLIDTYALKDYFDVDLKQAVLMRRRMGAELIDFIQIWAVNGVEAENHEVWIKNDEKLATIHAAYFQPFSTISEQNIDVPPRIAEGINNATKTFVDKFFRFKNDGSGNLNHPLAFDTLHAIQEGSPLLYPDPENEAVQASFMNIQNDPDMQSARERLDIIRKTESRFA